MRFATRANTIPLDPAIRVLSRSKKAAERAMATANPRRRGSSAPFAPQQPSALSFLRIALLFCLLFAFFSFARSDWQRGFWTGVAEGDATALPLRVTATGDDDPFEEICTVADCAPWADGAKRTPSWQSSPGETD